MTPLLQRGDGRISRSIAGEFAAAIKAR